MNYFKQTYFGQFRNIKTISSIITLSIVSSLFSLVIPMAVQILVNYMIFGRMLYPIVFLSLIIFVVFLGYGIINLIQELIIEVFQQKMFVDLSMNFSKKLNLFKLSFFENYDSYESINLFFETPNIQKTFSSIIIYGTTWLFQLMIALTLLASYHPYFILYDGLLILGLYLSVKITLRPAMENAIKLCKQKHEVASWFESMNQNFMLFKFSHCSTFFTTKTDSLLCHYLKVRNLFFKYTIRQQMGLFFVGAVATSSLLLLGGYLVINDSLSLGQLIASELILGGLVYTLKNLINLLEQFYNLISSIDKVEKIVNPSPNLLEKQQPQTFIEHQDLQIDIHYRQKLIQLKNHGMSLLIFEDLKLIDDFILSIFGFEESPNFTYDIDGIRYPTPNLMPLRKISLILSQKNFFVGSIYENLCLNQDHFPRENLYKLLKKFDLIAKITEFQSGLDEIIYLWDKSFTPAQLAKLLVIRYFVLQPRLCILNGILDDIDDEAVQLILESLRDQVSKIVVISSKNHLKPFFENIDDLKHEE